MGRLPVETMTARIRGWTNKCCLRRVAFRGGLLLVTGACSADRLNIPNYNSPTTEGLRGDPAAVQLLVNGILADDRDQLAVTNQSMGILGREAYNYFPGDGRFITSFLAGIPGPQRLDPNGFASGLWQPRFGNIKNAVELIAIADGSALSVEGKAGVAGFAKTFRALDLLYVIATRDTLGAPVDIPLNPRDPAPFVSRDSVYRFISATLDEARGNLEAAGESFPFSLHSGFAGFATPATFLQFNRAIAARALVIRGSLGCGTGCYQQALVALTASFISPATSLANLNRGVYHIYSGAPGDKRNENSFAVQNYIFAHAGIQADAQSGPSGTDARYTRKIVPLASPVTPPRNLNIPATLRFNIYPAPESPAPVIRNEELMLMRAEAQIFSGNLAAALQDINAIRQVSGSLPPLGAFSSAADALDALLYERRYSLLLEGHRWIDHRRFNRLSQLPLDRPGHFVAKVMPIPQAECDARAVKPNGCT